MDFPEESFDVILSSLAFHYVADYENLIKKIYRMLKAGGNLVFTVEHPVFTAHGTQDWYYNEKEKYCISRWTIIIMRANGQLCFWKKRLQNIIEH